MATITYKPNHDLTFDSVPAECKRLAELLKAHPAMHELAVDLTEVHRCDSAGLALLIEAKRSCKEANTAFNLLNIPKKIQALAVFCGVNQLLK